MPYVVTLFTRLNLFSQETDVHLKSHVFLINKQDDNELYPSQKSIFNDTCDNDAALWLMCCLQDTIDMQ